MSRPWIAAAALLALTGVVEVFVFAPEAGVAAGLAMAVVLPLPLVLLPRMPLRAAALLLALGAAAALTGAHPHAGLTPIAIALAAAAGVGRYAVGDRGRMVLAGACGLGAVGVLVLLYREPDPTVRALPFFFAFVGGAFVVGRQLLARAREHDDLEARRATLERERAAQVERAVRDERERIATELHAIIATSVERVARGAARADEQLLHDPPGAVQTLREVRGAAHGALTETRRLLGLLRAQEASYAPQPGLTTLAEGARAGGYAMRVVPADPAGALPAGLELALVRIVEEAVAAVAPHDRPSVQVEVVRHPAELTFTVSARGAASPWPERAPIVAGMRERVRLYGGVLRPSGGPDVWSLHGTLPLAEVPA